MHGNCLNFNLIQTVKNNYFEYTKLYKPNNYIVLLYLFTCILQQDHDFGTELVLLK